jgi:hypothetical protein
LLNLQTKAYGQKAFELHARGRQYLAAAGWISGAAGPGSVRTRPEVSVSEHSSDRFKEERKAFMGDNVA